MLNTLLDIGEVLRKENPIDTYRYFVEAPKSNLELKIPRRVQIWSVALDGNFDFDIKTAKEIVGNVGKYYTFRFKTTEADSYFRYVCGDIYYSLKKNEDRKTKVVTYEEFSPYRTKLSKSKSCFENVDSKDLKLFLEGDSEIARFRESFAKRLQEVEDFLYEKAIGIFQEHTDTKEAGVVLHFDFVGDENGRNWFERKNIVEPIKRAITKIFFDEQNGKYILNKSLYHATASHQEDSQFPNFDKSNQYKTRGFSQEEAESLFHAIKFVKDKEFGFSLKDLKVAILPKTDKKDENGKTKLTSKLLLDFFNSDTNDFSDKHLDANVEAERNLAKIIRRTPDPILEKTTENVAEEITRFDLIFIDTSAGQSSAFIDSVTLSGVEKSLLSQVRDKVKKAAEKIYDDREKSNIKVEDEFEIITIANAFKHILEIPYDDKKKGYDDKKYQSYLLKTLPKVYSNTYYRDTILLNWLIENAEAWIRGRDYEEARKHFILTRFDWKFLNKIQVEGEKYMSDLTKSNDYNIGVRLGELCRPVGYKKRSFTATHAGMLTRRVSTVEELRRFILEVYEILCRNKLATTERRKAANELLEFIKTLQERDYDKFRLGLGFFESYFKQKTKEDEVEEDDEAVEENEEQTITNE